MKCVRFYCSLLLLAVALVVPVFSGPTGKVLQVGVLFSQTGTMAPSELPMLDATLLAIEEVNARGGLFLPPERRLVLQPTVADGGSQPTVFARQAQQMMNSGIQVIFGCWTSDSRQAVAAVVEKRGGLLFYPVQFEGEEESKSVIYSGLTANQQLFPALEYLLDSGKRKIYLVGSDYHYPRVANRLSRKYWTGRGGSVVGEIYRPRGCADYAEVIQDIGKSHCDAVLNTINGDSQKVFFSQYQAAGLKSPIMSTSLSETQAADMGDVVDGHYCCWSYFQSLNTPQSRRFRTVFQKRYGQRRMVDDPCATAYYQVMAFAQAVARAGRTDPSSVRQAMKSLIMDTPGGLVRYDPKSLYCWKAIRIGQFDAGRAKVVWSSELPIKPEPFPEFQGGLR